MSRSLIIGIVITVVLFAGLATFFYYNYIRVKERPAIEAIPDHAAIIFEAENIHASWQNLAASDLWQDLKNNEAVGALHEKIRNIDSLLEQSEYAGILADNKTILSLHKSGIGEISLLAVFETGQKVKAADVAAWIAGIRGATVRTRNFEKEQVFDIVDSRQQSLMSIAFKDRLLLCSEDGSLVEEGLRKLRYKLPNSTRGFDQAIAMAQLSSDVSIYVNYQYLRSFLSVFSKTESAAMFSFLEGFANWSILDVTISKDIFNIAGVTFTDDSLFQFLDLFKTQQPVNTTLSKYMPANTGFALSLGFSDYAAFSRDLAEYLQMNKKFDEYTAYNDSLENRYNIEISSRLMSFMGDQAAICLTEPASEAYQSNLFALVHFKDAKQVQGILESYINSINQKGEGDSADQTYNGYRIRRLQLGNFLKVLYGNTFEAIYSPYYVLWDDVFIFANDAGNMKTIIDNLASGNVLANDTAYAAFGKHAAHASNVSVFLSPAHSYRLPDAFANDAFISAWNRYQLDFKKMQFLSVQYSGTNNKTFYTNVSFKFNPSFREGTRMLWMSKLDTSLAVPPAFVYNSTSRTHCILAQDLSNNLYFVNESGSIQWRTRLSGRINSQVYEVDVNSNGETQYLFSTSKQVCLIGANGNNVSGYPVRFPGTATAGIALFDFYEDSTYNYFVPLENNRAAAYSLNGKPLKGWNPKQTGSRMMHAFQSFRMGDQVYVYSADNKGSLRIFSYTGEEMELPDALKEHVTVKPYINAADTASIEIIAPDTSGIVHTFRTDAAFNPRNDAEADAGMSISDAHYTLQSNTVQALYTSSATWGIADFSKGGTLAFKKNNTDSLMPAPYFTRDVRGQVYVVARELGQSKAYSLQGTELALPVPVQGVFGLGSLLPDGSNYLVFTDAQHNLLLYRLK